jgi:deazaflavin-dependent oxidoreductase (nitroreductase family)
MPYIVPYVGSRAYDVVWGTALRATTVAHRFLDKVSGGRLMRRFPGGSQVVWITTLGRRSGEWRRTPLLGVPVTTEDFHGWGIAGSNAGQEKVPGWVFNVRSNPSGTIQIEDDVLECTFREVDGDLARDIYRQLGDSWSSYRMYERNIKRSIPIFVADIAVSQPDTGEPS